MEVKVGQISSNLKSKISCLSGVLMDSSKAVLLFTADKLVEERKPHVVVGFWDGDKLKTENYAWTAVAAALSTTEVLILGGEGEVLAGNLNGLHQETPIDVEPAEGKSGLLRNVCAVDDDFFIVGMRGQAYRRTSSSGITMFDHGLPESVSFEAVSGFTGHDLYAVGWKGEIWHFDGSRWNRIDSPTNLILTTVLCAPDGYVYAGGQAGILLKGRGSDWSIIEHDYRNEYFWSLAWFSGALFVASNHLLLRYNGFEIVPMSYDDDIPFTFFRLSVGEDTLGSFGPKDIMTYDGSEWKRIF